MSSKAKAKSDPQPDPISARADESVMSGGRMLFTGPDYLRDHRVKVDDEHRYIGIGTMHPDASSELDYITRANPDNKPKLYRKNEMVGEIGWSANQKTGRPLDIEGILVVFTSISTSIF